MSDISISLPLYSDPYYSYITAIEGQSYEITIRWNERDKGWYFDLYLEDGTALAIGNKLVADYPMLYDYYLPGLSGFFFLETISETQSTTDPRNLNEYYNFFYIYPSE